MLEESGTLRTATVQGHELEDWYLLVHEARTLFLRVSVLPVGQQVALKVITGPLDRVIRTYNNFVQSKPPSSSSSDSSAASSTVISLAGAVGSAEGDSRSSSMVKPNSSQRKCRPGPASAGTQYSCYHALFQLHWLTLLCLRISVISLAMYMVFFCIRSATETANRS